MLAALAKGLLLRLTAYALFLGGFWLLYQAFQNSAILQGIGGGAAILVAMGAMTGFRRRPAARPKTPDAAHPPNPPSGEDAP